MWGPGLRLVQMGAFFAVRYFIGKMRALAFLILFAGLALVMHGVYEEKLSRVQRDVRVEYRFIPRTLYDEQLSQSEQGAATHFKDMFQKDSPWPAAR